MELSEFDVRYQPREAIKAQALVDFVVEFTPPMIGRVETMEQNNGSSVWMLVHIAYRRNWNSIAITKGGSSKVCRPSTVPDDQ